MAELANGETVYSLRNEMSELANGETVYGMKWLN